VLKITPDEIAQKVKDRVAKEEALAEDDDGLPDSREIIKALQANEDGDARLFWKLHDGRFVYDHSTRTWCEWSGHYWREDITAQAMAAIDDVVKLYEVEAKRQAWASTKEAKAGNDAAVKHHEALLKELNRRIKALQSALRKKNVQFLSTVGRGLRGDEWDRLNMVLPCSNGCIDLRTGEHRPGQPEDYIKTVSPTPWDSLNTPCPTWEKFIYEILAGDQELIEYVQKLLGYGISGEANLHILAILWGSGRNGKGTLLETVKHVLGNLSYKTESELLLKQKVVRMTGTPNAGILALRGKRIVFASESDEGRGLSAARVKELTGGDTLNARPLYGRHHIEFCPRNLLMLLTNHKPHVPASDYALWPRLHLVPFPQAFVENPKGDYERQADTDLSAKLRQEASGILAWLVRGCLEYQRVGLKRPSLVVAATEEYQRGEDFLGRFIDEFCVLGSDQQVKAGEFYRAYHEWAEGNGSHFLNRTQFGLEMKRRFDSYQKRHRFYIGVAH